MIKKNPKLFVSRRDLFALETKAGNFRWLREFVGKSSIIIKWNHRIRRTPLYLLNSSLDKSLLELYFEGLFTSFKSTEVNNVLDDYWKSSNKRLYYYMDTLSSFNHAKKIASNLIAVFDEGPAQRSLSLMLNGAPIEIVNRYLSISPLPDLLIYLKGTPTTIEHRLQLRNGFHSNKKSILKQIDCCESAVKIYDKRNCATLVLNTAENPQLNLKILNEAIKKIID